MKLKILLTGFIALSAVITSGCGDYEQQVLEAKHYCYMVDDGYWPSYDDSIDCEKVAEL